MASNAVGLERVSKIVGYLLTGGDFSNVTPNLPQRIAILAEANQANQGTLSLLPKQITTAKQAGDLYGYGSPIHIIMRILRAFSGAGVGGIPTVVYPQAAAVGATASIFNITPSGVATGNGTHYVKVAGRNGLDGQFYAINIVAGDSTNQITQKIQNAVNNILGCPFLATSNSYVATLTSKWNGLTANDLTLSVDTNGNSLGITYTTVQTQAGSGTPDITGALGQFGTQWNTIVVNSYGLVTSVMGALEAFNGHPDPVTPTGRYASIVMKPFIAIAGSVLDNPSSITDPRLGEVTIAVAPAPLSLGMPMEAAANMTVLFAVKAQNTPELDVSGQYYPDMPTPDSIGSMAIYDNRDYIVQHGCSTVDLSNRQYIVTDFVTTYHPTGEVPPQFRYCRNLNLDFNVRFGYYLLEQINVIDHVIANNNDIVASSKVVKPKQWIAVLSNYALDLVKRGLIVDAAFMQASLVVNIGVSNPDRFETYFKYKRSGVVRIASTTAQAGFNFGTPS